MEMCTYIIENMLFKIPAVGSTKIQTLPLEMDEIWQRHG